MWYAVFEKVSGRLVSVGSVLADPLPDDLEVIELGEDYSPNDSLMWDEQTRSFVPRPPKATEEGE